MNSVGNYIDRLRNEKPTTRMRTFEGLILSTTLILAFYRPIAELVLTGEIQCESIAVTIAWFTTWLLYLRGLVIESLCSLVVLTILWLFTISSPLTFVLNFRLRIEMFSLFTALLIDLSGIPLAALLAYRGIHVWRQRMT